MGMVRPMIEIDEALCDGCGQCVPSCHEGALVIRDGKARVVADQLCDGLGACVGDCPTGALKIVEREAPDFVPPPHMDPQAAAAALAAVAAASRPAPARAPAVAPAPAAAPTPMPASHHGHHAHGGGCPGSQMRVLKPLPTAPSPPPAIAARAAASSSPLGHWPVQIRLVPPHAPFLDDAELVVAADCVPVAMPTFHADLLAGRAVMIGCPKFDDLEMYAQRFAQLFATAKVKKVVVAVMEVPCCQSLPMAVLRGMDAAGANVPVELLVVGVDGTEMGRRQVR